jgi:transglutaminase-like putative cysteine protease
MISDLDLDRVLAAWLAEGPERAPAQDVAAALRKVDRTSQRHGVLGRRGMGSTLSAEPLQVAAALVVVVVVAATAVVGGRWTDTIGRSTDVDVEGNGVAFGSSVRIAERWLGDANTAFTAVLPTGAPRGLYWRAVTFNEFNLQGWDQTELRDLTVTAGSPLMADTAENPTAALTTPVTSTVRPADFRGNELVSLGTPTVVDQPSTVRVAGDLGWFTGVDLPVRTNEYTVDAAVLRLDVTDAISGNRLRAAPEVYPEEITKLYTGVPPGTLGVDAKRLLEQVKSQAESPDPYDLAIEIQRILGNQSVYAYDTDVTDLNCTASQVECFARYKRGYCLHYASTMAMLLRAAYPDNPIPTRLVEGFLPGDRVRDVETVKNEGAHAWVEIYFDGFGWIGPFDPIGPGDGQPSVITDGPDGSPGG